jgi:hypothetical protein
MLTARAPVPEAPGGHGCDARMLTPAHWSTGVAPAEFGQHLLIPEPENVGEN